MPTEAPKEVVLVLPGHPTDFCLMGAQIRSIVAVNEWTGTLPMNLLPHLKQVKDALEQEDLRIVEIELPNEAGEAGTKTLGLLCPRPKGLRPIYKDRFYPLPQEFFPGLRPCNVPCVDAVFFDEQGSSKDALLRLSLLWLKQSAASSDVGL